MPNMKASAEILIVGAGPVGLILAVELRRDGVDVLLIEQMAQRSFFCKALGVTVRTLEIFEDLGLEEQAIDAGVWLTGITVFNDGKLAQAMEVPTAGLPYGALSLAQFETERLLEEGLHRRGSGGVRQEPDRTRRGGRWCGGSTAKPRGAHAGSPLPLAGWLRWRSQQSPPPPEFGFCRKQVSPDIYLG
jgi:hypothetical protein